jgi:hypothetical protein
MFRFKLIFKPELSLVQSGEFVDLVLVFPPNLHLVTLGRSLVLFGELQKWSEKINAGRCKLYQYSTHHSTLEGRHLYFGG